MALGREDGTPSEPTPEGSRPTPRSGPIGRSVQRPTESVAEGVAGSTTPTDGRNEAVEDTRQPVPERTSTVPAEPGERSMFAARDDAQEPERRPPSPTQKRVLAFSWLGVSAMSIYGIFMMLAFFSPGYRWFDGIAAFFLLLAVLFILVHGLGYANSMIKASTSYDEVKRRVFSPQRVPKVACIVACFNEPPEVLEETVAAMSYLDYPNKEIVILDDSTKEEVRQAVRDIAARYNVGVRQRTNRRGYKAGAINDYLPTTDAQFLAIFDADCLPAHNFLRDLIPIIEENPKLAFVQTPQFYANTDVSHVAMAASRQQAVFYEYICEGKDRSRAMFCCGTNVLFRREALLSVGGFEEANVTEDFATSLSLHLKGYDSTYYNQIYAYGLGPETLPAYFTQQGRWAFGSVGEQRRVLKNLFTHFGALRPGQWWEYILSSGYYWVGWVNFVFMLLPMLYIFFGVKPLRSDVFTYLAIFLPYLLFTMNMFYAGMEQRGYKVGEMLLSQQINFITFPIHMSAALRGILGLKQSFKVTPKGVGGRAGLGTLWPQLLMLVLSGAAFIWGTYRYVTGLDRNTAAILINSLWALYHVFLLSGIFRLNGKVTHAARSQGYFNATDNTARIDPATGNAIPAGVTALGGVPAGRTGSTPTVFSPVNAQGQSEVSKMGRRGTPSGAWRNPSRTGRLALGLGILTTLLTIGAAWTLGSWYATPAKVRNVYIVDRTTGRDYQEHRALTWTLNYLKVGKKQEFDPSGSRPGRTNYDYAADFFGHIPGNIANAVEDKYHQGDMQVISPDRPIPAQLDPSNVLYLADTYGEFVEFDYRQNKYIHYLDQKRGLSPDEVDEVQDFANGGGLILAEWNTLGYPTLPGPGPQTKLSNEAAMAEIPKAQSVLTYLTTKELVTRQADLKRAQGLFSKYGEKVRAYLDLAQKNVDETQTAITRQKQAIVELQNQVAQSAQREAQLAAQRRLQGALHVAYQGFYGRYVDKFEDEHEFDFRLWKNVADFVRTDAEAKRVFPDGNPRGPGFVFYKDGPSIIVDPDHPNRNEESPFSKPILITQADIKEGQTSFLAGIYKSKKPEVVRAEGGKLLRDVAEEVPCRFWFDVVKPAPGATVLASYKLQVKEAAIQRLLAAGFPKQYVNVKKGEVFFPASVAYREGGGPNVPGTGALRSFYFAGDASDYPLISRINEMFPATGRIQQVLGSRVGPFSTQFYWNYYEPMIKNIFNDPTNAPNPNAGR